MFPIQTSKGMSNRTMLKTKTRRQQILKQSGLICNVFVKQTDFLMRLFFI